MKGILYAVGVGPGDPELLTIKALRVIEKADVIVCPAKDNAPGTAYRIAEQAYPEIAHKKNMFLDFPMKTCDLTAAHKNAAESIISLLHEGKNAAFLTLGDPCFYSTFFYIAETVKKEGYKYEIINGITSFSAVLGRLGMSAALGDESVMITSGEYADFDGTLIIMKAGKKLKTLKERINRDGKKAWLVENCCMADEKVYSGTELIPDKAGYFSILIVK